MGQLVVQSVVSYHTADAARDFFTESTDRWSKCTNHNVNIQLNGQALPAWHSGELTKTHTRLAIPYTRGAGDQTRWCEHALSVVANLILDIQACKPQQQSTVTQAAAVADKIEAKGPQIRPRFELPPAPAQQVSVVQPRRTDAPGSTSSTVRRMSSRPSCGSVTTTPILRVSECSRDPSRAAGTHIADQTRSRTVLLAAHPTTAISPVGVNKSRALTREARRSM